MTVWWPFCGRDMAVCGNELYAEQQGVTKYQESKSNPYAG